MKLILIACLFVLCGCQAESYTLSSYIEDVKALFLIEEEVYTKGELHQPLLCQDMVQLLLDISHEDIDYLYALGCIDKEIYENNEVISKETATNINQRVYEDLYQKMYYETTFDIGNIISTNEEDLEGLSQGIYEKEGKFYEIDQNGNVSPYELQTFELQSTFTPDLSTSLILPEGSEITPVMTSFQTNSRIDTLASHYFKFKIKDYNVSGRVQNDGLQVKVSKKTENGVLIENELLLEDLKCTVDFSLQEKEFYFRADYSLKDSLSVSKSATISKSNVKLNSFEDIQQKIQQLTNISPLVEDELHLLTFQFDIPSTGKLVKMTLDLSLRMMVNGEAKIVFSQTNQQGYQSFQNTLNHLHQQKFTVDPYIEGNIECASELAFGLNLGSIHIADVTLQGGLGAQATTKVHYVDTKEKVIETSSENIDLLTMEQLLSYYDQLGERYIEACADVDVYYFGRIRTNQQKSLLRELGLYGSMTPIKKNLSLLHIENHQVIDACTKGEILFNPEVTINAFDISNYQLYLTVGNDAQLTSTTENCHYASSNESIVSVDKTGKIKAIAQGYATIIVTDKNGVERHCLVFVQE